MLNQVMPIRGHSTDCLQDLIITTSSYFGCDYELGFSESMGFDFISGKSNLIGKSILNSRVTSTDLLEEYHGIKLMKQQFDSSIEAFSVIESELKEQRPIIIYLSSFWNPWGNSHAYQILDTLHYCLVIGLDEQRLNLICVDPMFSTKQEFLPVDHFLKGNNGVIYRIEKIPPQEFHCENILHRIAVKMVRENNYLKLHDLADAMQSKQSFDDEYNDMHDFWTSDYFQGIDTIFFGRKYFSKAMRFLNQKNTNNQQTARIYQVQKISEHLADQWDILQKMVIKQYLIKSIDQQISHTIRDIIQFEEQLYQKVRTFV